MPIKKKKTQLDRIEQAGNRPQTTAEGNTQLDRIEHAINGNGREGLLSRAARLETLMLTSTENSLRNSTAIADLKTAVYELKEINIRLKDSVDEHHRSLHLNILFTKVRFWVILFGTLIGFNLISRYIPGAITFLFALFGVSIHIPLE